MPRMRALCFRRSSPPRVQSLVSGGEAAAQGGRVRAGMSLTAVGSRVVTADMAYRAVLALVRSAPRPLRLTFADSGGGETTDAARRPASAVSTTFQRPKLGIAKQPAFTDLVKNPAADASQESHSPSPSCCLSNTMALCCWLATGSRRLNGMLWYLNCFAFSNESSTAESSAALIAYGFTSRFHKTSSSKLSMSYRR